MCLALPVRIISVDGKTAVVETNQQVSLALVPKAKKGDYLLVHNKLAVNKLSKAEADKIFSLIDSCPHSH